MKRKDAPKSPGNKDKTQKKVKLPTPQTTEIPSPVESINKQSTVVADSLTIQDDQFVSAGENLQSTHRTVEEQETEQYAEQIESLSNEQLMSLLHQSSFYALFERIQATILPKLLECTLNGASFYRHTMKIIRLILQSDINPHLIISFTNSIHIPNLPLSHLKAILDHQTIRKEVSHFFFINS